MSCTTKLLNALKILDRGDKATEQEKAAMSDALSAVERLMYYEAGYSGVRDKNGVNIRKGDKVQGLFYHNDMITGICDYDADQGAYGLRWKRGDTEEFTPFCACWNVAWEVVYDE